MKSETVSHSVMSDSETACTVGLQASLSMGLSRQEYWSGWPFPSLGDVPDPGIEPRSPTLQADFYHLSHHGSPSSVNQFTSVTQLCPAPSNHMDCSKPGFPVHHKLLELAQTHVHGVSDAIQPSHPLSFPSPSAFNLSQHQSLFQ